MSLSHYQHPHTSMEDGLLYHRGLLYQHTPKARNQTMSEVGFSKLIVNHT